MMQHLTTPEIIDYLHRSLPPQADARAYSHLETCEQCRREYDAEAALSEMLRSRAAEDERDLPPTLKAEIWSRIRDAQPSPWSRLTARFRPAVAVPIALAVALAAYFGTTYLGPQGGPSIAAAYYLEDHEALNSTVPFADHSSASPADLQQSSVSQAQGVTAETAVLTADAGQ